MILIANYCHTFLEHLQLSTLARAMMRIRFVFASPDFLRVYPFIRFTAVQVAGHTATLHCCRHRRELSCTVQYCTVCTGPRAYSSPGHQHTSRTYYSTVTVQVCTSSYCCNSKKTGAFIYGIKTYPPFKKKPTGCTVYLLFSPLPLVANSGQYSVTFVIQL